MHFMDAVAAEQRDVEIERERQEHELALEARYVRRRLHPVTQDDVNLQSWYFAACGMQS